MKKILIASVLFSLVLLVVLAGCEKELVPHNPMDPEGSCYIGQAAANEIYAAEANLVAVALRYGYEAKVGPATTNIELPQEVKEAEAVLKETASKYGIVLTVSYKKL